MHKLYEKLSVRKFAVDASDASGPFSVKSKRFSRTETASNASRRLERRGLLGN